MDPQQRQQLKRFLDIFLRKRKLILSCLFAAIVIGLTIYVTTPKVYKATSLIVFLQPSIKTDNVSTDDKLRFIDSVNTMAQQVTSRTGLEELIKQFDLYPEMRKKMPLEDVVVAMRQDIKVDTEDVGDSFRVSFQGSTPSKIPLVTNALAAKFIEENLRLREEQVSETSAYLKDEVKQAKEALAKKEKIMTDYKLEHFNEMPEQRQTNLERLTALQGQYQINQKNLQELERTRVLLQEQIQLQKEMSSYATLRAQTEGADNGSGELSRLQKEKKLQAMRYELDNLLARYTEQHPDVKKLKALIETMQTQLAAEGTSQQAAIPADMDSPEAINARLQNSQLAQLGTQLDELNYNVSRLKEESLEIKRAIDTYQGFVAAAPTREAEWAGLTRDYEQLHRHYEKLLALELQAGSAESLEKRQKGSQFKIIDPAVTPEKPFKPNFISIMLKAIFFGLVIGCGLAFVIEILDTSFRDASDLENYLGLQVVCSIPVVQTTRESKKAKIRFYLWTFLLVSATTTLTVAMIFLWHKGIIII